MILKLGLVLNESLTSALHVGFLLTNHIRIGVHLVCVGLGLSLRLVLRSLGLLQIIGLGIEEIIILGFDNIGLGLHLIGIGIANHWEGILLGGLHLILRVAESLELLLLLLRGSTVHLIVLGSLVLIQESFNFFGGGPVLLLLRHQFLNEHA